jgi:hypothetical protein
VARRLLEIASMMRPRARVLDRRKRASSITLLGFACFRVIGLGTGALVIALEHTRTRMDAFIAAAS